MFKFISISISRLQQNPLRFEVIQNAGIAFVVKAASMLTLLLFEFFVARILELDQFGIYTFVLIWVLTLTIVGMVGFNVSAIRYVSEYFSDENNLLLGAFIRFSQLVTIIVSVVVTLVSLSVVALFARMNFIEAGLANVFYVALPLIPFFSLLYVQSSILRGGKFLTLALFFQNVIIYALVLLFILFGFYFGLIAIDVETIFVLFYISLTISLGTQHILIQKKFDVKYVKGQGKAERITWFRASVSMMLSSSFQQLINRLDIIAIGIFIAPAATGVYAIALRFSKLINVGLQITNESSAHLFKPLYSQGKSEQLQSIVFTSAKITLITTIPIIAVLMFFPTLILSQYGEEFVSGRVLLQILLIGQLANVLSGPNGLLLNMTEFQDSLARVLMVTFFIDGVLLVILLPLFGVTGAAIATAGAIVFRNIATNIFVWKNLNINPTVVSRRAWQGSIL